MALISPSLLQQALLCFGLLSRRSEMHQSAEVVYHLPSFPRNEAIHGDHMSQPMAQRTALWLEMCVLGYVVSAGCISVLMKTPLRAISLLTPQLLGCSWCCHGSSPLQGQRKIMFLGELQQATTASEVNGICPFLSFLILDYYCYLLSLKSPYNNNTCETDCSSQKTD